ncbi:efflux RND transporter permease subunit [Serratia sp. 22264]|uniref:efflux RND transporter permease subunit n=1 Tax=Serratia sp. 22264 TaxID=3453897 RepID=UPI003F87A066
MNKFNLSDWALEHRSLVWYFIIISAVIGFFSYQELGREEDPAFTIKTMVIQAQWPGATAEEMTNQVTDRIEKKLQEIDTLDHTRSQTTAGQTIIFVDLKEDTPSKDVRAVWQRVRNMMADIQADFPAGIQGPFLNDRFDDVFGNIYAFTSEGISQRQLRDYVNEAQKKVLTIPNVGKVEILGAQDEVIYLEFNPRKSAELGVSRSEVIAALQAQNAVTASGFIEAGSDRIALRVDGGFASEQSLRQINLRVNNRFFPLTDVVNITRGYVDPPTSLFRYQGKPAIALAVGIKSGSNLLVFGHALDQMVGNIMHDLPAGVSISKVSDQPAIVDDAVSGFTRALFEAVVIVLAISFISLGVRAGLVVAISIPLVLAITFLVMYYAGISLQRISLGALIIALGLLVDDAMIATEMMVARLEMGDSLRKAATHVYTSTAFPMLTGTLVTVASFIPVGFNASNAGEFLFTLFVVIAVSLIVSWVVAVLIAPLLGVALLPKTIEKKAEHKSRTDKAFSRMLHWCLRHRWLTIGSACAAFIISVLGMSLVQHQFFPSSDRPELIVDWNLPQNSSIEETSRQMVQFEREALQNSPDVDHWSSYIGTGAPRFILSFDVQPSSLSFGQTVIVAKDIKARDRLQLKFKSYLAHAFPGTDAYVKLLDIGPPVGKPVQYRVAGPDIQQVRSEAHKLAAILGQDPALNNLAFDWNEPARVVKVNVMQDKARQMGVSSQAIAQAMNVLAGGETITQVRDDIYLINVVWRGQAKDRGSVDALLDLQLDGANGQQIPLSSVATFSYQLEQPTIWRRDRAATITLKAGITGDIQPATIVQRLEPKVEAFRQGLPQGYSVETGGAVEESAKAQAPIVKVVPVMLFVIATILMIQLQSFHRLFLVFSVAPLALIGVVAALLLSNAPLGFVAILGVLALVGILIRNSVILVVHIDTLRAEGISPWQAVVQATEHRMRPIMLTAAAATLALIPIAREIFWGPMAYAMMGGIIIGTLLTLLFLPALYVTWFKIPQEETAE